MSSFPERARRMPDLKGQDGPLLQGILVNDYSAPICFARLCGRETGRADAAASTAWALRIARIRPGNRPSISSQREVLRSSTPWRSERIRPASRSNLKCCDSDDFEMVRSPTQEKAWQV